MVTHRETKKHEKAIRTSHPFRMWDIMMETPNVIRRCLTPEVIGPAVSAGKILADRGVRRVFLVGCGTSYHAAVSTMYAFQSLTNIDADAYNAFEFSEYRANQAVSGTAVLAFSHSGNTKVTVDCVRQLRKQGALTVAITDLPGSLLGESADLVIPSGGGPEPVEPKTRSFINALVIGYRLAASAVGAPAEDLNLIPDLLERCQKMEDEARILATRYAGVKRVLAVGGGPNCATALEIALKFKEAVLLAGEGLQVEEAFHGPIASLDRNTLVIAISAPGPSYEKVGHFAHAASEIGSPVVSVTPEPYDIPGVHTLRVPLEGLREAFSPPVLVYPLYYLAYYSALVRGNNPDAFRVGDEEFHRAVSSVPSISYGC